MPANNNVRCMPLPPLVSPLSDEPKTEKVAGCEGSGQFRLRFGGRLRAPRGNVLAGPGTVHYLDHLIQMRIDFVREAIEALPLLAEVGRFVRRLQLLAAAPLDVVDDALAVEAA